MADVLDADDAILRCGEDFSDLGDDDVGEEDEDAEAKVVAGISGNSTFAVIESDRERKGPEVLPFVESFVVRRSWLGGWDDHKLIIGRGERGGRI